MRRTRHADDVAANTKDLIVLNTNRLVTLINAHVLYSDHQILAVCVRVRVRVRVRAHTWMFVVHRHFV